ncbi:MAG: ABC transporter permease [Anaerolineae bacterium]
MSAISQASKATLEAKPGPQMQHSARASRLIHLHWRSWATRTAPLGLFALFVLVWHSASLRYPAFILPAPAAVVNRFVIELFSGNLVYHTAATLFKGLLGLFIGALLAFALGYPIAKSRLADRLLSPFIVASQGVPFIAIAPLLMIWFGPGAPAKILLCTVVVFFPITVNVIAGIRGIKPLFRDLFRSMHATPWETFIKLEAPAALPLILTGLRIGATLSIIAAITAEFLGTDRGLGFLINQGRGLYDTTLVLVGIVTTVISALSIYGSVRLLERLLTARRE